MRAGLQRANTWHASTWLHCRSLFFNESRPPVIFAVANKKIDFKFPLLKCPDKIDQ